MATIHECDVGDYAMCMDNQWHKITKKEYLYKEDIHDAFNMSIKIIAGHNKPIRNWILTFEDGTSTDMWGCCRYAKKEEIEC